MKLLFSEARSDYEHYIFPYAVWAFPEPGETPARMFEHGFLPSARDLSRFYLCRQIRVRLAGFKPNSENRRILRKGAGLGCELLPLKHFRYTDERRRFCKNYADIRFGKDVLNFERLDHLFNSQITSHVLRFTEESSGAEVGLVTLFIEEPAMAYYYYAFYDLAWFQRNIGMFMMTRAAQWFAAQGIHHLYLGSCYSTNALYKFQFHGAEFFNGVRWSDDEAELRFLIGREQKPIQAHLFECEDYRREFWDARAPADIAAHGLSVSLH